MRKVVSAIILAGLLASRETDSYDYEQLMDMAISLADRLLRRM